ncbi:MAG: transcription antitermination factor NusB [Candidatus Peribacteraceae bacterium]|jgi:N utilization substance protein B|nr:transcription antitermination factor NusB [Candidatus Peribacteraceae bacterium]|tara:strand:- start:3214 stop:3618 length:405 start_codon:yes stop_codon:yes gene_type:complete
MARKRHLSRIAVMQVLFERAQHRGIDEKQALAKNVAELGGADEEFCLVLLEGVTTMENELRAEIEKHAPEWEFDKMDPIARPVLLIGAFELLHADDAPPAVVMNEGIDIAKEYGTEETGKFVNGVLNAIANNKS